MQKVIGIRKNGGPEVLEYLEIPKPSLSPKDPSHKSALLVRLYATGINPVDTKRRQYAPIIESPKILGYDGSGIVEEIGSDVTNFKIGSEVYFAGDWNKQGTYAQYCIIDSKLVGKKPKSLSFVECASIPLVALTAYEGLIETLKIPLATILPSLKKKKTILIIGGAGGVGSIAIQIAKKLLDLTVIATASRQQTITHCKSLAADYTINHSDKDFVNQIKALGEEFESGTVDYIFNTISTEEYLPLCKDIIAPLGQIVNIVGTSKPLDIGAFMAKRVSIHWELMFTRSQFHIEEEKQGEILSRIADLYDQKVLVPTIFKVYEFDQIHEATIQQESGNTIGKLVVKIP